MSDLTKRAKDAVDKDMQGHDAYLAMVSENTLSYIVMWTIHALDAAGMLTDLDPRITAASAHADELRRVLAHVFAEAGMLTDYDVDGDDRE